MPAQLTVAERSLFAICRARCADILKDEKHIVQPVGPRFQAEANFSLLLIYLTDLLDIAANKGSRVSFSDNIEKRAMAIGVRDVTDLVHKIRDAACHVDSAKGKVDDSGASCRFGVLAAKGAGVAINGVSFTNDYDDDVVFHYGKYTICLNRHIRRAYAAACAALDPLLAEPPPA